MRLIEFRGLGSTLIELRAPGEATVDGRAWAKGCEVSVFTDSGQIWLTQGDAIVPVDTGHGGERQRIESGPRLWHLIDVKEGRFRLRCADYSSELVLDLSIGVDERIVQQLHEQGRIPAPTVKDACGWLREEFVLTPMAGHDAARVFARGDDRASGTIVLLGRRQEADLREQDGTWRLMRLAPARRQTPALVLFRGAIDFVDAGVAATLRSPAQRQQLREYLEAHGDYVELWRRYSDIEWQRATAAGRELGLLRFRAVEVVGDEHLDWRFEVDPGAAHEFERRWGALRNGDRQRDALLEVCAEPPAWLVGDTARGQPTGKPLLGRLHRVEVGTVTLRFDGDHRHEAPQQQGVLCLAVHGERKVRERREDALRRIRMGENPLPQLRHLLEGQSVPLRSGWRVLRPLSPAARKSFRGEPTPKQKRALELALNTPDIAVIIGPPGTGKTQVISALQQRLAEEFKGQPIEHQLLIASFQHDAVDNALERTKVFGLPALKVGRRSGQRGDAAEADPVGQWCQTRRAELLPKLSAELERVPAFALLDALRTATVRLRIQPLEAAQRRVLAHEIDAGLRTLADEHGVHLSAATEARWRDWSTAQGQPPAATRALDGVEQRLWRRSLRALRTTPASFADDGPRQCRRLLDRAAGLEIELPSHERNVLEYLTAGGAVEPARLEALGRLRDRCLDASRPDYRPPELRRVLDEAGCELLDTLLQELDGQLRRSPAWGHLSVLNEYLETLRLSPRAVENAVREYTSVLGATCQQSAAEAMKHVLGLEPGTPITFDTVVIDEAARATPLDLLIPMAMGRRRIVLVGDHRQLPHLLDPETEAELDARGELRAAEREALGQSLFERLVERLRRLERDQPGQPQRVVMLDTQFRMHPVLGDFVSRTFYEAVGEEPVRSGLDPGEFAHRVPGYEGAVCAWIDLPATESDTREPKVRGRWQRSVEAERVAREARRILEACPELSLGIITFYSAQRDLILERLIDVGLAERGDGGVRIRSEWQHDDKGRERLRVGTVDAFQGKEFDVVLLSVVRTDRPIADAEDERALNRKFGFLRLANRLNVAMSRQRQLLIAVGDAALARAPETRTAAPGLAGFITLCEEPHGRVR